MKKPSLIPAGVRVEGEIEGEGDLIVLGHVDGPIRVEGALVVEEGGLVRGHVHARLVTVRGALKGDAFADDAIRVEASGRLVGDLTAPRVRVIPGAQFSGQVHVRSLEVAPPLRSYDPALHTFTGLPAPGPVPDELARGVSIVGAPTPMEPQAADTLADEPFVAPPPEPPMAADTLTDDRPPAPVRERPSRARGARPAVAEPVETEAQPERRPEAPEASGSPSDSPKGGGRPRKAGRPPVDGRMPRVGRVRGAFRDPR